MPRDLVLLFLLRPLAAAALLNRGAHRTILVSRHWYLVPRCRFVGQMTLASFKRGISNRGLGKTGWPTGHES